MSKHKLLNKISTEITNSIELHPNDWKLANWRYPAPTTQPEAPAFKLDEALQRLRHTVDLSKASKFGRYSIIWKNAEISPIP